MPEIKHNFSGGKMEKDLDERLVPNGQYRDAMNIQVSTSEDSDVGTVQNILGNQRVLCPIGLDNGVEVNLPSNAVAIGSVSDEKVDTLYWLVWTPTADYIFSFKRKDSSSEVVFRDMNKDVLKFDPRNIVTGINVVDGMLFWTDNKNEPKKINIKRCKEGTPPNTIDHTKLINRKQSIFLSSNINVEEKHITVIKKTPERALGMKLISNRDNSKIYTGVIETYGDGFNFSGLNAEDGNDVFNLSATNPLYSPGQSAITTGLNASRVEVPLGEVWHSKVNGAALDGLTGWQDGSNLFQGTIPVGTKVVLAPFDDDGNPPGLPITNYTIKGTILDSYPGTLPDGSIDTRTSWKNGFTIKIDSIIGVPKVPQGTDTLKYAIDLFDETEKLFEFKFPRFSYRYKYSDGEYSPFASFTQPAFLPGAFDFHPRKGYNLGMTNRIVAVELSDFIYSEMPKNVVSVDILFKEEQSPNIYIVDTITPDGVTRTGTNIWNTIKSGGNYKLERETINAVVPSNQLLRPWDNVPRKALAQDITGNRIVYGNYVQNYTLTTKDASGVSKKFLPEFSIGWGDFFTETTGVSKSIKSLREYQLGVVFIDKYGRETPVMSNNKATIKLEKNRSDRNNRIDIRLLGNPPEELTHFKFFIKETEDQYYNMAMDRWYDAEDDNVWLAFASSDRNKVDIDTFLILKKGADSNDLVKENARFKILAIENEAPDFIKTTKKLITSKTHDSSGINLFTGLTEDQPLQTQEEFKLKYEHYSGSSGQNLVEIQDKGSDLYIEFGKVGTPQLSQRYKITSISNDFTPDMDDDNSDYVGGDVANYTLKLDKQLDADVNFISNDPNGNSGISIDDGAIVNIYEYKVENLPQFDGRFFVKIYYNDEFINNIAAASGIETKWVVRDTKKLFSMRTDHYDRHTKDTGWCLTRGVHNTSNNNTLKNQGAGSSLGSFYRGFEGNNYGYYRVDTFSSFAMYFRRYMNDANFLGEDNKHNIPLLVHLKPSPDGSGIKYEPDQKQKAWVRQDDWEFEFGVTLKTFSSKTGWYPWMPAVSYDGMGSTPSTLPEIGPNSIVSSSSTLLLLDISDFPGRFSDSSLMDASMDKLKKEEIAYAAGLTANWEGFRRNLVPFINKQLAEISGLNISFSEQDLQMLGAATELVASGTSIGIVSDLLGQNPFFAESNYRKNAENARDTEVWFIDNGPYVGEQSNYENNLIWRTTSSTSSGGFVNSDRPGITTSSGGWSMDLGFGGIQSKSIDNNGNASSDWFQGFFNIGDWNSQGNDVSNFYQDGPTQSFVNRLNFGQRFRFKEDPTQTVYTVGEVQGGAGVGNLFRHSGTVSALSQSDYVNDQYLLPSTMTKFLHWVVDSNQGASVWDDGSGVTTNNNLSMAEEVGFNFSKNWKLSVTPELAWNPMTNGLISGGLVINLAVSDNAGNETTGSGSPTCTDTGLAGDLKIFVTSLKGLDSNGDNTGALLKRGMALSQYALVGGTTANLKTQLGTSSNEFLVIRHIVDLTSTLGHYELWLGGYRKPMDFNIEHKMATTKTPALGTNYKFVQVGMNGYSDNSEFNINTLAPLSNFNNGSTSSYGKVGAVGYNIEFVETITEEDFLSDNPAVWETEPKETKDLDIYYEASPSFPIKIEDDVLSKTIPVGSMLYILGTGYRIIGHNEDRLVFNSLDNAFLSAAFTIISGNVTPNEFAIVLPNGLEFRTIMDPTWLADSYAGGYSILVSQEIKILTTNYNSRFILPWHNCYSFGNGVESNRIRDSFNLPFIINGVKASTTLEQEYKEEHRKYGLIFSGIYNSISGVNNLNQFIQAEKITKDINPIYGSIQKLHSRDSDLITLCEDKCLKILANKDAVFNADGNPQLTANERVLGQTIPFSGEYGISTNPESFASESYRAYFTDKVRGAVLRLSKDGLTPISNFGMNDWFKDNLKLSNRLIGSYDDKKEEYNLTLKNILYYPEQIQITTSDGTSTTPITKIEIEVENPPGLPFTDNGTGGGGPQGGGGPLGGGGTGATGTIATGGAASTSGGGSGY